MEAFFDFTLYFEVLSYTVQMLLLFLLLDGWSIIKKLLVANTHLMVRFMSHKIENLSV